MEFPENFFEALVPSAEVQLDVAGFLTSMTLAILMGCVGWVKRRSWHP